MREPRIRLSVPAWAAVLSLTLALGGPAVAEEPSIRLETLDGQRWRATSVHFGHGETVELQLGADVRSVAWKDVWQIEWIDQNRPSDSDLTTVSTARDPGVTLLGRSGWQLTGRQITLADEVVTLIGADRLAGQRAAFPLDCVAAVVFAADGFSHLTSRGADVREDAEASTEDRVVLRSEQGPVALSGLMESVTEAKAVLDYQGELTSIDRANVLAIEFAAISDPPTPPQTRWRVSDRRDGLFVGTFVENPTLMARSELENGRPGAMRMTLDGTEDAVVELPWSEVVRIDRLSRHVLPLSQLEPIVRQDRPQMAHPLPPRRDEALTGTPLTIQGETFATGLSLQAGTELTIPLPTSAERFVAQAGLDDAAGGVGDCDLLISADGIPLSRTRLRGGEAASTIAVDLRGRRRLVIRVEAGPRFDLGDHVDLGSARLILAR